MKNFNFGNLKTGKIEVGKIRIFISNGLFFLIKRIKTDFRNLRRYRVGIRPEFVIELKKIRRILRNPKNIKVYILTKIAGIKRYKVLLRIFTKAVIPPVLATLLFFIVRPISAQLLPFDDRLNTYLAGKSVDVGTHLDENGITQIYFKFEGEKIIFTDSVYQNENPVTERDYIVWMSQVDSLWQIFLYHIPTKQTIQLTFTGNNANPRISDGNIVWEADRGFGRQIYLYDGKYIGPISYPSNGTAINPDIENDYVIYSVKDERGMWRSEAYSIRDRKTVTVAIGDENKYVVLDNGDIFIGESTKDRRKFSLKVSDLFLLDLPPVDFKQDVSGVTAEEQMILDELQALINQGQYQPLVRSYATESAEFSDTIATQSSEIIISTPSAGN